ncbi:MAG: N-acetylmuramoyl-L-alanine amidase [Actinobacteria bacterium]|nr:N-acetylmuramoyl-L-alanine amidase [Actinomycetota bacterium]MBI3687992.1 N-acetylmuramoyl-L-alanine amidase [Actinomycetota bacterium]
MAALIGLALLISSGIAGAQGQRRPAGAPPPSALQRDFTAAAAEFDVPAPLLLAVSYTLTRWEDGHGRPDATGGFGPMHLTFVNGNTAGVSGNTAGRVTGSHPALGTLEPAAALVHVPAGQVSRDARQNIRAGAALLASYASAPRPATLNDWYDAVARYAGGGTLTPAGRLLADEVFGVLGAGAQRATSGGQMMVLAAQAGTRSGPPRAAGTGGAAQCPAGLTCGFRAATGAGSAQRATGQIRYLVLGATGTTYEQAIAQQISAGGGTSSHYLIRGTDGQVTQLVRTANIAPFSDNATLDARSVSIGLDRQSVVAVGEYSDRTYTSLATLVRYLGTTYGIPLDRQHILGWDEVPSAQPPTSGAAPGTDGPGPLFDWGRLFDLLDTPLVAPSDDFGQLVAIVPVFGSNPSTGGRPGNSAPLRTAPNESAPLVGDPADTGDQAVAGQVFAVAGRLPGWTAIWYAGQQVWLRDGDGAAIVTRQVRGSLVTPAPGLGSAPVYTEPGQAGQPGQADAAGRFLAAGQSYPLIDELPDGWDLIAFGHRLAFVHAAELSVWPG